MMAMANGTEAAAVVANQLPSLSTHHSSRGHDSSHPRKDFWCVEILKEVEQ